MVPKFINPKGGAMTNPNWYKTSFRRNLVDMHIEDWNPEFLSQFDPDDYYDNLVRANVKSPMIYLQSHVGHCNWDSKSGFTHKSFVDCTQKMQRLFDLCHQGGMDVIVYYSLIYNNDAYVHNPDWRLRDIHGRSTRHDASKGQYFGGSRYGLCCPNNEQYRQFVLEQLDEIFDLFTFEGIFLDMTFWTRVCYCNACKAKWAEQFGGEIPTIRDWTDPAWRNLQFAREDWMQEFMMLVTNKIKSRNPNCAVEHQYSTMMHGWNQGVNHNVAAASTYCGGDFYGGAPQHSVACKLYYNMTQNQPFEYMTSRCYPGLAEHTTTKTMDMLELSVMSTFAHHGAALLIDAIDPRGTLDKRLYDKYGIIFRKAEKYEKYMEGELAQDVAILYNLEGKYNPARNGSKVGTPEGNDASSPHTEAMMGAARALLREHIPFGVVSNWKPEKADKSKLLLLANAYDLPKNAADYVEQFVAKGGTAYMSGLTNPELVEKLANIKLDGTINARMTYIVPTLAGQPLFDEHNHDYPMAVISEFQKITLPKNFKGEILATIALPYPPPETTKEPNPDPSDGSDYEAPNVRFASIHSNPPGQYIDTPSIVKATYGKGTVIYSAAPFETFERPANAPLLANIIRNLVPESMLSFSSDAPMQVEILRWNAPKATYINLINSQDAFQIPPICDFNVKVKAEASPKRVLKLPEETPIPFTYQDGFVTIHIDKLHICDFYKMEL